MSVQSDENMNIFHKVTYQNVRKFFEHSRFFCSGSTKMSEKSLSTKMSENEYQNLRKILLCLHTKKLQKFQNFQNLKYSSESAWRSNELNYWTIEFNSDGNFKNRVEFVKIQKFILVSFLWFSLKNDILGLKWMFWNFSEFNLLLGLLVIKWSVGA